MTPIENTENRYGTVAILFHWSMALLVIGLAALGLYMVTLPDVGFNTNKEEFYRAGPVLHLLLRYTSTDYANGADSGV
jgi:cytochrome b561